VGILRTGRMSPGATRATVGRFVSLRSMTSTIVAMITEVSCENLTPSDEFMASASVDLLGEILDSSGPPARVSSAASRTIRRSMT